LEAGRKQQSIGRYKLKAKFLKIEISDDFTGKGSRQVSERGELESGKDLLRDGYASDDVTAFQDQNFLPGLG
jgi:hypothetical protein